MGITDYILQLSIAQDGFLSAQCRGDTVINEAQITLQNNNTASLLPCLHDRYHQDCLLFDVRNHVTLHQYVQAAQFSTQTLCQMLRQLVEGIDQISAINLRQCNILVDWDYIYIDLASNRFKYVYLPLKTSISNEQAMLPIQQLLKNLLQAVKVKDGFLLLGLMLQYANNDGFHIAHFYKDLLEFDALAQNGRRSNALRVSLTWLTTTVLLLLACVGVPFWGIWMEYYAITQFVSVYGMCFIGLLFLAGTILSFLISLLFRGRKVKRAKEKTPAQATPEQAVLEQAVPEKTKKMSKRAAKAAKKEQAAQAAAQTQQALEGPEASQGFEAPQASQGFGASQASGASQAWEENRTTVQAVAQQGDAATQVLTAYLLRTDNGAALPLLAQANIIGRDAAKAGCVLDAAGISGKHALVELTPQGYTVADCGSKNGTNLNGRALEQGESLPLQNGDLLSFANVECRFCMQ